ncbi:carboxymuconolactone decarboxylase family protein [Leptospira semungkisensis]|uniref:Carboxymuconolactone decarboxylase family protein n=1 Tax=Leptospira semungkisensis TaxID=2484985 RepID=A0A4R9FR95_9LEPT|nr:carboxymuconolactone decarboxylase family protein [Leptospira semungkisensis]TGK01053.1 carboxymuconolactone decarboxylase family protein [Leptospira semungkisensis]
MRLQPIDKPKSILLKLAYIASKIQFGKVIAPLRFIYSRSTPIMMSSMKILSTEKKLSLPKEIKLKIRFFIAHLNECKFCSNLQDYISRKESKEFVEWKELSEYKQSSRFSNKEKALFSYLEEVTFTKKASDSTFETLRSYFSEKEIVEITWICATENYFNLLGKPLGLNSDEMVFSK